MFFVKAHIGKLIWLLLLGWFARWFGDQHLLIVIKGSDLLAFIFLILHLMEFEQSYAIIIVKHLDVDIWTQVLFSTNYWLLGIRNENVAFLALRKFQDYFDEVEDTLNYSNFVFNYDLFGDSLELLFNHFNFCFDGLFQDATKSDSKVIQRSQMHPCSLILRINGHVFRFAHNVKHLANEIDQLIDFDETIFFSLNHFLIRGIKWFPVLSQNKNRLSFNLRHLIILNKLQFLVI